MSLNTSQTGIQNFLVLRFYLSVNLYYIFLNSWIQEKDSCSVVVDIDNEDAAQEALPGENKECASGLKSKKVSHVASAAASNGVLSSNRGSLVQATISTLFKKVEEKVRIWNC